MLRCRNRSARGRRVGTECETGIEWKSYLGEDELAREVVGTECETGIEWKLRDTVPAAEMYESGRSAKRVSSGSSG